MENTVKFCLLLTFVQTLYKMKKKFYTLLVLLMVGCQSIPSASVPEADDAPIQIFKTSLVVTVRDNLGNVVEDAQVKLFNNKEDYQKEENVVNEVKTTDSKGRAKFIGLDAKAYYVNVVKGDMNNYGAGIKTDELAAKRNNRVTIIIE